MQLPSALLITLFICGCGQGNKETLTHQRTGQKDSVATLSPTNVSYTETKKQIADRRKKLAAHYLQTLQSDNGEINEQIKACWIVNITNDLFKHWAGTPWDFNGTTLVPKQGTIACGYFVTTLLLDMGLPLNRIKLSTCAASEMMQKLVPHQPMKKLNSLTYSQFCNFLKNAGKEVYIIGLDYHVGFIVNDGQDCWFIHSNYINKQGVIKELIQYSAALQASNTRWLVSLTNDKDFIIRWLTVKD